MKSVAMSKFAIVSFVTFVTVTSAFMVPSMLRTGETVADAPGSLPGTPTATGGGPNTGIPMTPGGSMAPSIPAAAGAARIVLMRVHFSDYAAVSRYTQAEVQDLFDDEMNQLWMDTSYGNMGIDGQVTDLYQLPGNRASYITDCPEEGFPDCDTDGDGALEGGDISTGTEFDDILNDAIDNSPAGLDWSNLDAIMVLMAETSSAQFYRGLGGKCNLPQGPGGAVAHVGCAVYSENPTENNNSVWGRWAHEIGHAFQAGGPGHPSNYNNEFELMDSNYPGQAGVFEKQAHTGFPGWMPAFKYLEFDPVSGGGIASIWAEEYDPSGKPNVQAVKAKITDALYYLISVRRRILGDDLNGGFTPFGIPDEGVLIERVSEGSNPWVTVQGNPTRNDLWHELQNYSNPADGIHIDVRSKLDPDGDNYEVLVRYDKSALQPDVAVLPWRSPPGDAWETTDIWFDSPVNGFADPLNPVSDPSVYRWGTWSDLHGGVVAKLNGDPPAVGLVNRMYARVRNIGDATATDVDVHFEVTDPLGVGIAGANGFVPVGSTNIPTINAGDYADVYVEWTPDVDLTPEQIEAGLFNFHSCVRVIIDHVAGETVFGNQDGEEEQENIDLFQAPEEPEPGETFDRVLTLRNDDTLRSKDFHLTYDGDLPAGWSIDLNGGDLLVHLAPNEVRDIPIRITPAGGSPLGSSFKVEVVASSMRTFVSDLDDSDMHLEFEDLGGVTVEAAVMRKPTIEATAVVTPTGILVKGRLEVADFSTFYDPLNPFRVMIVGSDANKSFLPPTSVVLVVGPDGSFEGLLPLPSPDLKEIVCLFSGTMLLSSASCGFVPLLPAEAAATLKLTPQTLNLKSNGRWVTARITFEENVADIVDPASLLLEGVLADRVQVLDGKTLLVKFSRDALIATLSTGDVVTVCVKGNLSDGRTFKACDTIRVIWPGK